MNRTTPTIDLFTLIGMMATIAGIFLCLFFLFTPTTFGAPAIDVLQDRSPDLYISMRWLQPTLGQAIVEDALIRQRDNDASEAVMLETEAGSVQWVIGRVVVELNRSRLVAGTARQPSTRRSADCHDCAARRRAVSGSGRWRRASRACDRPCQRDLLILIGVNHERNARFFDSAWLAGTGCRGLRRTDRTSPAGLALLDCRGRLGGYRADGGLAWPSSRRSSLRWRVIRCGSSSVVGAAGRC